MRPWVRIPPPRPLYLEFVGVFERPSTLTRSEMDLPGWSDPRFRAIGRASLIRSPCGFSHAASSVPVALKDSFWGVAAIHRFCFGCQGGWSVFFSRRPCGWCDVRRRPRACGPCSSTRRFHAATVSGVTSMALAVWTGFGSHSCGALSSHWPATSYRQRTVPSSTRSPLAKRLRTKTPKPDLSIGPNYRTFLMGFDTRGFRATPRPTTPPPGFPPFQSRQNYFNCVT